MLFYERNNEDVASLQKNTHLDTIHFLPVQKGFSAVKMWSKIS